MREQRALIRLERRIHHIYRVAALGTLAGEKVFGGDHNSRIPNHDDERKTSLPVKKTGE